MGADLYIRSKYEACRAKYQPAFDAAVVARDAAKPGKARDKAQEKVSEAYGLLYSEGYFRDSYNSFNLFSKIGLSWWQDVTPLQNDDGEIAGENIHKFIAMLEAHPVTMEAIETFRDNWKKETGKYPDDSAQELFDYYAKDHAKLIAFCKEALALGEPIDASL